MPDEDKFLPEYLLYFKKIWQSLAEKALPMGVLTFVKQGLGEKKEVTALNILIAGCGRVGAGLANALYREGHDVSVVDRRPESIERPDASGAGSRTWERVEALSGLQPTCVLQWANSGVNGS